MGIRTHMSNNRQRFIDLISKNCNEEVIALLSEGITSDSLHAAPSLLYRGVALQQSGQLAAAIDAYREGARLGLNDVLMCWSNLSGALYNTDHFAEAVEVAEQLAGYKPFDINLMALQMLSLVSLGRKTEAETVAREFAVRVPRNAEVARWAIHANWRNKNYLEALLRSADISPAAWDANGLGHELLQCLIELDLFDVAKGLFPVVYGADCDILDRDETWATAGLLELSRGNMREARAIYEAGLARGRSADSAILNLAVAELWLGDYESGWRNYMVRGNRPDCQRIAFPASIPRWQGEDVSGKTVIVSSEQGIGDMIQFLRFVPALERRGARIVFASYPEIVKLLRNDPRASVTQVAPLSSDDIDYHALLLDLPHRLGLACPDDVPCDIPYLFPNHRKVDEWREALAQIPGLRVGLVWAGNPEFSGDHYRSASVNIFSPLAGLPGVTFIALQKGEGAREARCPPEGLPYRWIGDRFASFEDTAAAIESLDLVISTDTSVVHLAAALGKPVWLLLSKRSFDFRWREFGKGNPWYPTVRVFQQSVDDDWAGLVRDQLRPALAARILDGPAAPLPPSAVTALAVDAGRLQWDVVDWSAWCRDSLAEGNADVDLAVCWLTRQISERSVADVVDELAGCVGAERVVAERPALAQLAARTDLKRGRIDGALTMFAAIAARHGDEAIGRGAYLDWAWHYHLNSRWDEALSVWKRALQVHPRDGHLHYLAGLTVRDSGQPKDALPYFRKAIECFPRHFAAYLALASVLREDKPTEAWAAAQKALLLKRNNPEVLQFVIRLLHDRGMYWLADAIAETKLRGYADVVTQSLRARQVAMLGRRQDAERVLDAIKLPERAGVQDRLEYAAALYYVDRQSEALATLDSCVREFPAVREARFNLGFTQLRMGMFTPGWRNYWTTIRRDAPRRFPEWKGEDLVGKTLLVLQDQGQGDAIQFFPLLRDVCRMGPKRMVVAVTPALVTLFRAQDVEFELADLERLDLDDYRYDFQVPIMALPYLLDVDLLHPRHSQPTLEVIPGLPASWQERLASDSNMKIGIVWSGGDLFKANYVRSTALSDWSALWEVEGVSFYSLQKDNHSNQAAVFGYPLHNIAADCPTWLETLSVIDSLDLVITTCTAVAHAAGSINKPTWVILSNEYVDFRWLEDREDSPWYPSVRLVRREKGECWGRVFRRVACDLVDRYGSLRWRAGESAPVEK